MEEGDICPKCGEGILKKPKVFYSVFDGRKQPDGVCERCGAFHWEHPDTTISFSTLKATEQKKEREPTFEELLKREEKKREKRRRYRRNRRRRKLIEAEKSRT